MRVIVIGGTGHVGSYLVPRLVQAGHDVTVISRNQRQPYQPHAAWQSVQMVQIDRALSEADGTFGQRIHALKPDMVIDMVCFKPESARQMVEALRGDIQHYLFCGTIWVHGPSVVVPTTEEQPRRPFGDYGVQKAAAEFYLLDQARRSGFPATCLHPGHIVGPGWNPVNPQANFNPKVFETLAQGNELSLPNLGMETVHHVQADDVAQIFMQAIANRSAAVGESFHAVSPAAVTLRGYAETVASWFGKEARLRFEPWEEWRTSVSEQDARSTWDHIAHSPNCSIAKARRLLDFRPRYSSLQAVYEAVQWMLEHGVITG